MCDKKPMDMYIEVLGDAIRGGLGVLLMKCTDGEIKFEKVPALLAENVNTLIRGFKND